MSISIFLDKDKGNFYTNPIDPPMSDDRLYELVKHGIITSVELRDYLDNRSKSYAYTEIKKSHPNVYEILTKRLPEDESWVRGYLDVENAPEWAYQLV